MFTNNWFEITAIKNFEKYVLPLAPKNALEIGCYEGRATVWLLENTKAILTVIDTFEGSKEHGDESTLFDRFSENIKPFNGRIWVLEGASQDRLKMLDRDYYDFIYIDGSHQASDVLEDAVLAFPLLKSGGMIIFDDYTWGVGMPFYDIPAPGIDAFLTVYGNQIKVLEQNSQVILLKSAVPPVS